MREQAKEQAWALIVFRPFKRVFLYFYFFLLELRASYGFPFLAFISASKDGYSSYSLISLPFLIIFHFKKNLKMNKGKFIIN